MAFLVRLCRGAHQIFETGILGVFPFFLDDKRNSCPDSDRISELQSKRSVDVDIHVCGDLSDSEVDLLAIANQSRVKLLGHQDCLVFDGMCGIITRDIARIVVGETSEKVPHVKHVVGNIDAGDDDGSKMVNFGLSELLAVFLLLFVFLVLLVGDQTQLGRNCEVAHRQQ